MPLTSDAIGKLDEGQILDLVIEEAAEIIYVASKAKRFGLLNVHPDKPGAETNIREIAMEGVQLGVLVRELATRFDIDLAAIGDEVARRASAQQARGIGLTVG